MGDSQPATILIVDDDRGMLRLMEKSLRRAGHVTATADSGRAAGGWLAQRRPDLMLLDLKLPDIGGRELIGQLEKTGRSCPFVIITGQGDERVAVDMMKRGALDYLVKDVKFLEFVPAVVERSLGQIERERKLAATEAALAREHAFSGAVVDTSSALVAVLDPAGRIVRLNPAATRLTGYSIRELEGRIFWEVFVPADERAAVRAVFARLCAGEAFIEHENHWLTRSGEPRLIAWSNSSLRGPDGGVEFLLKTGIDITERKRLEAEILKISEQQQQRIGQDLHDGICQQMAGIELMSQVLQQNLAEKSRAAADQAALIGERVRDTISETRRLARGLCPVVLESEGLMAALSELAASTERATKGRCRFQCKTPVLIGDHAVATHLYRIAQEAVSNALRHGHGSRIDILLSSTPGHLALTVRDNGVGLPEDALRRNGMGLRVMSYRAGMIGGTLAVQRAGRKGGTTVVCSVRHPAADSKEPPE